MRSMKAVHSPTFPAKQIAADEEDEANSPLPQGSTRPLLVNLFAGLGRSSTNVNNHHTKNSKPRVRVGSEDEVLKKNRRHIDNYLRRIGALKGKEVSLNADGICYFSYKCFVTVVEVPMDNNGMVYIYTMVCRVGAADNMAAVLKKAMELNYMEYLTRGATLGLDGEEVNLCYSTPVMGLAFHDLKAAIEAFLLTATEVHEQLDAVKKI